ncbi:MAG: hypothetical protein IPQ05_22695 [Leptospiraceae bacterium]|nr:hypothetical protein [Leptospiraceae bacterium]MBL0266588.1 hypothetical protein [Leptospiraceae bacterium]MBP6738333.1 hypothetical protein [Leptospiraceae bacterium]
MTNTNKTIIFPNEVVEAVEKEISKDRLNKKNFSDFIREATLEKLGISNSNENKNVKAKK